MTDETVPRELHQRDASWNSGKHCIEGGTTLSFVLHAYSTVRWLTDGNRELSFY